MVRSQSSGRMPAPFGAGARGRLRRPLSAGAVAAESRPTSLGTSVYDVILHRLISKEIEPGARISVDGLARELGVSQTPIREVLSRLESEGLVTRQHLVGYRAAPLEGAEEFAALFEFRRLVEPKAAALAAARISPEQSQVLSAHLDDVAAERNLSTPEAYSRFARGDVAFHGLVAAGSGNHAIREAIANSSQQLHLFRRAYNLQWIADALSEHRAIYAAIAAGDPAAAEAAMLRHLEQAERRYMGTLS